jgi:hypothetical protein
MPLPIRQFVVERTRGIVQAGPFAGMRILPEVCWGDGDLSPKLLGVYEQELQPVLAELVYGGFDAFINIGCGEGYYAVGVARLVPDLPVYAYDLNPDTVPILQRNAALNGVAGRIQSRSECLPAHLAAHAAEQGRLFILSDCENYEKTLFTDPQMLDSLRDSHILIETHDFMDPDSTTNVFAALWPSHRIDILYPGARNPNQFSGLARYSDRERWDAINEHRPCLMNWLYCRPR